MGTRWASDTSALGQDCQPPVLLGRGSPAAAFLRGDWLYRRAVEQPLLHVTEREYLLRGMGEPHTWHLGTLMPRRLETLQ